MRPVEEFQQIADDLLVWQGYDPAVKTDLWSTALRVGDVWHFIDPIPLAKEPLEEIAAQVSSASIILTNGNHERAAQIFREKLNAPIIAHELACRELRLGADIRLPASGIIPGGGITAIPLPGAGPGEIALHAGRVVVVGDALVNLESTGFTFLPDKYCADAKLLRSSLLQLASLDFTVMTFAHGTPIVTGALRRLEKLLA